MRTCDVLRALVAWAVVALVASLAPYARAQAEDRAAARSLFDEGRKLSASGQYAAACEKFEAATRFYRSAGILLNLGDCYEKLGRTASAWTEFREAASVAARTDRASDAAEATRRQTALEPGLVRLTVRVPHEVPGLAVKRDGALLARAAWGTPIPVDPGTHEVSAEAEGYGAWSKTVDASNPGQTASVELPELRPAAAAEAPAPTPPGRLLGSPALEVGGAESPRPASRAPAWVLAIGGAAVGIGGAAVMVAESIRANNLRANHDPTTFDNSAQPLWTAGLVGAIAGGASVATGVIWLVASASGSPAPKTDLRGSAWFDARGAGFGLGGRW